MRNVKNVILFTCAYLAVATLFAFSKQNWEFVFYIGVVVVLGWAALTVHRRANLPTGILWGLSIWGLLHMVGGLLPIPAGLPYNGTKAVFYSLWIIPEIIKYDHVVHAYGFGIATWLCFEALRAALPEAKPTLGILSLCALAGMGLGAVNEIVEFTAVLLIPETNVGGYANTGWDMVSNAFGAIVAACVIGWRRGRDSNPRIGVNRSTH